MLAHGNGCASRIFIEPYLPGNGPAYACTNYLDFADDNIQPISYTNTAGQPLTTPTQRVSYSYKEQKEQKGVRVGLP